MAARERREHRPLAQWAALGAAFGVAAGVVFAAFQATSAWLMGDEIASPLRLAATLPLGERALESSFSLAAAAPVGTVLHLALSALYGATFAAIVAALPGLRGNPATLVAGASAFGLALWLWNFVLVAPLAFPWLVETSQVVQFFAHTFLYGSVLGALIASRHPRVAYVAEDQPLDARAADEALAGERFEASAGGRAQVVRSRRQ